MRTDSLNTPSKRFGSVCSGIEAATAAWSTLGWSAAFYSEIEPFPCELLAARHPDAPNLGDMTAADFSDRARALGPIDVLVGGTPCQAFSFAGNRLSLADARGNLTSTFTRLCHELDPRWVVWENVPGVLSVGDNAFGCFLSGLVGGKRPLESWLDGGRWPDAGMVIGPKRSAAWRILDAQYFGLAQRRRRVYVVSGRVADRTNPGAVLFEPESMPGNPPPRRQTPEGVACCVIKGAAIGRRPENGPQRGEHRSDGLTYTLNCTETHAVEIDSVTIDQAGTMNCNHEAPIVVMDSDNGNPSIATDASPLVRANGKSPIVFYCKQDGRSGNVAPTLRALNHTNSHANGGGQLAVAQGMVVRRLTPLECERLQGFADEYTLITRTNGKPAADGPRYRSIGNSMPVTVMRWLGRRIDLVDAA